MTLTTKYHTALKVNLSYSKDQRNKNNVKAWEESLLPKCKCFVCKQKQPTRKLSKEDRQKYKSDRHPICNHCRKKLSKDIPRYKAWLRSYYLSLQSK